MKVSEEYSIILDNVRANLISVELNTFTAFALIARMCACVHPLCMNDNDRKIEVTKCTQYESIHHTYFRKRTIP
jgi:hypothetical protein